MNGLLEEYLARVEGGEEVLAANRRELARQSQETEAARKMREEERLMSLERAGEANIGSGELPDDFWELPIPDDPTDSVRQALEEDRG